MKSLILDLQDKTEDDYLDAMALLFGFPDWWGHNLDALNDCLTTLRGPKGDEMTSFHLEVNEKIVLEVVNTAKAKFNVTNSLYSVIEGLNQFFFEIDSNSAILLDIRDGNTKR